MIKYENGKVEIVVNCDELMKTMVDHEVTTDDAMLACVGCDLTYIFNELVKIYGFIKAFALWYGAYSAYKDVLSKGENEND